jgi:hypothetical protein
MIEIFAMEYKKRSKGDNNAARTQTTFRYCSALWRNLELLVFQLMPQNVTMVGALRMFYKWQHPFK